LSRSVVRLPRFSTSGDIFVQHVICADFEYEHVLASDW
jgi:hypothetical protein